MGRFGRKFQKPEKQGDLQIYEIDTKATAEELERVMRGGLAKRITETRNPLYMLINGYDSDPRELWDIPEAVALCQRVIESGFISLLGNSRSLPGQAQGLIDTVLCFQISKGVRPGFYPEMDEEYRGILKTAKAKIAALLGRLSGSEDPASAARKELLAINAAAISVAVQAVTANGGDIRDVVMLVVDAADPVGAEIARAYAPEAFHEAAANPESESVGLTAIPRAAAAEGLRVSQPTVSEKLRNRPADGYFFVVCVARGGATVQLSPLAPGPADGEG